MNTIAPTATRLSGSSSLAGSIRVEPLSEAGTATVIASLLPGIDAVEDVARLAQQRTHGAAGLIVDGTLALVHASAVRFVNEYANTFAQIFDRARLCSPRFPQPVQRVTVNYSKYAGERAVVVWQVCGPERRRAHGHGLDEPVLIGFRCAHNRVMSSS